jgi:hypothetical protein
MLPQTQARKKRNSSKVNLTISFVFHALLVLGLFYLAARQGLIGHQLQKIAVDLVKEKKPEQPKPPPKQELPKPEEQPKVANVPKPVAEEPKSAPPPEAATVAPAATELPSFDFEGGAEVVSGSPVDIYKNEIEQTFQSKWNRPDNMADDKYVAEVQVSVDRNGRISNPVWQKGSGNDVWDASVRAAVAAVTMMSRPPPTNFPPRVIVRFDVQEESEPLLQ